MAKRTGQKVGRNRYRAPAGARKKGVKTYSGRQMRAYWATGQWSRQPRKGK
jgi:hypothetical protein